MSADDCVEWPYGTTGDPANALPVALRLVVHEAHELGTARHEPDEATHQPLEPGERVVVVARVLAVGEIRLQLLEGAGDRRLPQGLFVAEVVLDQSEVRARAVRDVAG